MKEICGGQGERRRRLKEGEEQAGIKKERKGKT